MATTYASLKGKIKWPKVYEPDEYAGSKRWMVDFFPSDGAEWEKITKSGLQVEPKVSEDGKYIRLRRDCQKLIGDNLVVFCPPEITGAVEVHYTNAEGDKVRSYNKGEKITINRVGETAPIGNGSLALVNISLFDTARGKGHRLESIKVLDLVGIPTKEEPKETDDLVVPTSKTEDEIPF